jgi:hypothetical protein
MFRRREVARRIEGERLRREGEVKVEEEVD